MLVKTLSKRKDSRCKNTYYLVLALIPFFLSLSGCEKSDDKATVVAFESPRSSALNVEDRALQKASLDQNEQIIPFASVVKSKRNSNWQGGAPPINKRASGIDTYYRLKELETPNHLEVTLRFEGANSDDAKVAFKVIDGAKFKSQDQLTHWRLQPNLASEISFIVVVPENLSYLTLNTFQNNMGASRAFLLDVPARSKTSKVVEILQ